MTVLYVDEFGEEGFSETSSEWLVIAGVIQPDMVCKNQMMFAYDSFKCRRPDNWHFHFTKASHDLRLGFIREIASLDLRAMAIAIHKPSIEKRENFKRKYFLYFYALRMLLERVTTWCSTFGDQKENLYVCLSSRKGLTVDNLNNYFEKVISSSFVKHDKMEWRFLKDRSIDIIPNKDLRGLQIADCVASAVGKAIEFSEYGTLEPRYLLELAPIFHHDDLTFNRAIKVWPGTPVSVFVERLSPIYTAQPKGTGVQFAPLGPKSPPP